MRSIPIYPAKPVDPAAVAQLIHGLPSSPVKGRGTAWQLAHRFQREDRQVFDDGWGTVDEQLADAPVSPDTQVIHEQVKSILAANDSSDIPFDLSINPYRGCEHVITRHAVCD